MHFLGREHEYLRPDEQEMFQVVRLVYIVGIEIVDRSEHSANCRGNAPR
jgi:hypothetical protein